MNCNLPDYMQHEKFLKRAIMRCPPVSEVDNSTNPPEMRSGQIELSVKWHARFRTTLEQPLSERIFPFV